MARKASDNIAPSVQSPNDKAPTDIARWAAELNALKKARQDLAQSQATPKEVLLELDEHIKELGKLLSSR